MLLLAGIDPTGKRGGACPGVLTLGMDGGGRYKTADI
jgi:hypothetical protein